MDQINHRFLQVNRLKLHVADIGLESSPAVIFLHGFPEIWYSWRHQLTAVANAGFRAIAPDFRGYGLSDSPLEPEKASYDDFVNDVVSILDSLHISKVFVIAKDFGTWIAYSFVLLHPEKIAGIITLGMAFMPPAAYKPDFTLPEGFYVRRWQEPGRAEADFGRFDVKTVVRNIYILFSKSEIPIASENQEIMDLIKPSNPLPSWFTEEDLVTYAALYEKSGFRTALQVPYSIMSARSVPKIFWPEAANWCVHVLNRSPTAALENCTPEEKWSGQKPSVNYFRIFGCVAHVHVPKEKRLKLDDVVFEEEASWNWAQESAINSTDLEWEDNDGQENNGDGPNPSVIINDLSNELDGPNNTDEPLNRNEGGPSNDPVTNDGDERRKRATRAPTWIDDYVSGEGIVSDEEYGENIAMFSSLSEPTSYHEAAQEECWKQAMNQEIKSIFALAAQRGMKVHQLDVKSAFLYGELEEVVFVEQPQGYVVQGNEGKVYRLRKALYGLKQEPRAWYGRIESYFLKEGFEKCPYEPTLFVKSFKKDVFLIVSIYVDDLIITWNTLDLIEQFKVSMKSEFEMSDMGEMLIQSEAGIHINQQKYAREILERFNMEDCNSVKSPMVPGCKLVKDDLSGFVDATMYKQMVGCIMYLAATRPDVMFVVGQLCRYMETPTEQHMAAMKKVLRYIQGTKELGIFYRKGGSDQLVAYSDSDYAGDHDNRRSTSGYVCFLSGAAIAWSSKRQPIVTLSTTEAEFVAATACAYQVLWLRRMLEYIGLTQEEGTIINCDNMSTIKLSKNSVMHNRSKHIDVKYYFLRDLVNDGRIELRYCNTLAQVADIMTKPLKVEQFEKLRKMLGMVEATEIN
nr:putative RNA-directed DNA polymerase [Tanacetum cinerariifolium]